MIRGESKMMEDSSRVQKTQTVLQARRLEWVAVPSSRGFPNPGIEPGSPALQADSLLSEPSRNMHSQILTKSFWMLFYF